MSLLGLNSVEKIYTGNYCQYRMSGHQAWVCSEIVYLIPKNTTRAGTDSGAIWRVDETENMPNTSAYRFDHDPF